MAETRPSKKLLDSTNAATVATNKKEFQQGLSDCFTAIKSSASADREFRDIAAAYSESKLDIRRNRILSTCIWPLLDKLTVADPKGNKERVYVFTVPFMVEFNKEQRGKAIRLEIGGEESREYLASALKEYSDFYGKLDLTLFPKWIPREQLIGKDPFELSKKLTTFGASAIEPENLEDELHLEKTASAKVMYLLFYAKVPWASEASERNIVHQIFWEGDNIAGAAKNNMSSLGWNVDGVTSFSPSPLCDSFFTCTEVNHTELTSVLKTAKKGRRLKNVILRFPVAGVFEINGILPNGTEITLMPPAYAMEPKETIHNWVEGACLNADVTFKGSFSSGIPQSSLLH